MPRPFGGDLLVLTGPTASGKSALALELAERHGLEILSVDSMSVYRRMDVGTAKPTAEDRARVPHHGIDLVEPWQEFDAARYASHADACIAEATSRGVRLLLTGGTPLYLLAVLRGFFNGPPANAELRAELRAREANAPGSLHERLAEVDPEAASRIHRNDTKRLVRALEVFDATATPISELQQQFEEGPPRYPYRLAGLTLERDTMRARVRERTQHMFEAGLVDEVRAIRAAGGFSDSASQAIGYREVCALLDGALESDLLVSRVRSATHRLVRRQETWFRRMFELERLPLEPNRRDAPLLELAERALLSPRSTTQSEKKV